MLNAMRDGAHSKIIKIILFGFLLMAVSGMALMDVGGFFRGGVGNNNVARIGHESLTSTTFDQTLQRVLSQQGMHAREAYQFGMVDQILQSEINNIMLSQNAYKMGIYAGDKEVAKQISTLIAPIMKEQSGANAKDVLRRILQSQGMSEQGFVDSMRTSMMNGAIQSAIQSATGFMPRAEAVNLYVAQNESRNAEGFILTNDSVKDVPEASEDVLKAFYEAAKSSRFMIPETRSFSIAVLDSSHLKGAEVSDEQLKAEYDKSIKTFTEPERRVIEQAVLSTESDAKKVMDSVTKDKKALKAAVKAVTGKTSAYRDQTTISRDGLTKDITDPAFAAKAGDVIPPIKTPLGWHVLVVKDVLPESVKPFESVKADLRKELSQGNMSEQLFNTANTIDDRLAGGETLEAIAKEMNMPVSTIGPVRADGSTADKHDAMKDFKKDSSDILKSVFDLAEGESAPVLELNDGRYAAIHVDKVNDQSFKPYEDVRDEIKKGWTSDQKASLNATRSKRVQQEIAAGGKSLDAAAAQYGSRVQKFSNLKQSDAPPKDIGAAAVEAVFKGVLNETVTATTADGIWVGNVTDITLPDPAKVTDTDLAPIIRTAQDTSKSEYMMVYLQYLQKKMNVRINRPLLNALYGPESNPG